MSEIVDESLRKIARGAGLVLIGTGLAMVLGMISRIIIARYVTQGEYGVYSLALTIVNILVVIATLGLKSGTPRQLAFYRGKGEESKIKGVVFSSLQIAAISSVLISLVVFLTSDLISTKLFHITELSAALRIFCLAIPFIVLINVLASIFQGFDRAEPSAYFQNISRNALFPILLGVVILLNLQFMGVIYAFMISIVLTFIIFSIYTGKNLPLASKSKEDVSVVSSGKELLLFSLPLLISMFSSIITWTDTLILGYFTTPDKVGLYNAALPLVHLLPVVLGAAVFLYVPLMSQLYARDKKSEIKRSYAALTKWIYAATVPIFLILILFPEATLKILFGSGYIAAAPALRILSVGFFIHSILGTNFYTLMVMGKTRFLMWTTLITVIGNIILNIVMIPLWGIVGAAIATTLTRSLCSLAWTLKVYSLLKIHPFTKNYLKPAIASIVLILIIYAAVENLITVIPLWLLPLLFILFLGIYALSALLTKSFDKEDIMMLLTIEERSGIDLTAVKRILKRFV